MDKDKFDALMQLAEFRNLRIASRRSHEWKVTVAVWALLAAGIAHPPTIGCLWLIVGLFFVVFGHAFLWIGTHRSRSKEDVLISFYYADRAHNIAATDDAKHESRWPRIDCCEDWFGFLREPGAWFQMGATILLAIGVYLAA